MNSGQGVGGRGRDTILLITGDEIQFSGRVFFSMF